MAGRKEIGGLARFCFPMRMNRLLRIVLVTGVLSLLGAHAVVAQGRMATVNLVEVFDNYWKTKQAKLALAESKNDTKKEIDSMQEAHRKLVQAYQKAVAEANDQAVSNEERDRRKKALEPRLKELRDSEETLKQFVSSREAELKVKTDRMMEDVIKDIKTVIGNKARTAGYSYVLDSSARSVSSAEIFLFNAGDFDLTKPVIDELNVTAPADAGR